jgi:voltage-gated potassium channel
MPLREQLMALGLSLPENCSLDPDHWVAKLTAAPCQSTATLVGLSTVLFYVLEKHHNPKVNDLWDAMTYCSTCISVGYGEIFPKTPLGKILGSALMTIGPSLAAKTLDGEAEAERDEVQQQVLETLRQILAKLEQR